MRLPPLLFRLFFRRLPRLLFGGVSVFLGVFIFTAFSSLLASTERFLSQESAEMMGGQLRLSYFQELNTEHYPDLDKLRAQATESSQLLQLTAMLRTQEAQTVAQIKVVDASYPLLGNVVLEKGQYRFPKAHEIYVQSAITEQFELGIGDELFLGEASFVIAGVLDALPDIENNTSLLGATAILSQEGFARTAIDRSASRVSSLWLARFSSEETQELVKRSLELKPPPSGIKIRWAEEEGGRFFSTFETVEAFLSTFLAMLLFFLGVSSVLGVTLFFQEEQRNIARMKAFGLPFSSLITLYGVGFFCFFALLGVLAAFLGEWFSLLGQSWLSKTYLPALSAGFSLSSVAKGLLVALLFFLLSFLWNASSIFSQDPRSLLRSSSVMRSKPTILFRVVVSTSILFATLLLLFPNFPLALSWFGALCGLILIGMLLLNFLIRLLRRVRKRFAFRLSSRAILSLFEQPEGGKKIVFLLFFLAFFSLSTTWIFGASIQSDLDAALEEDSPSFILLDIQKDQLEAIQEILPDGAFHPIVRARLLETNGEPIDNTETRRDVYNLTYRDTLLPTEDMIQGSWWEAGSKEDLISLEKDFASDMGLGIGDTVRFDIQGISLNFTVSSIRQIQENRFSPWFIFVTPQKTMEEAPSSFIGFSWLMKDEIPSIQTAITQRFPNVTSARTEEFSRQIQEILGKISLVVLLLTSMLLFAGFFSFVSILLSDAQKKRRWFWRFRLFGASPLLASRIFAGESFLLFTLSFLAAYLLSVLTFLGAGLFFPFLPDLSLDLVPLLFFLIMSGFGILMTLLILQRRPQSRERT